MDVLEQELISKSKKGDFLAFEILINKYSKQVFNILLRLLGNREDAEDVSQEVFVKVYKKLHTYKGNSQFYTWLFRIAINAGKDHLKKKKWEYPLETLGEDRFSFPQGHSVGPEATVINKEKKELILRALMELKLEQRAIIILRDIQGFSYEEISGILGISIGTVKSRISRTRKTLKEKLINKPYGLGKDE